MATFAGLEMGGTKTIAVLGEPGRISERIQFPTTTPIETLGRAADQIERWDAAHGLAGLGVGCFGPIRVSPEADDLGTILATPKPGWRGVSVLQALRAAFAGPIAIDTDVNAAALAEYEFGAARGCRSLVYLTIGTGVGGGILIEGLPVHGALHPEIGHMRLRRDGSDTFVGSCPYHGACVEGLISGTALHARFGRAPREIAADDPAWAIVASDLAELLTNLLLALSPERIVVGGGVIMGRDRLLDDAIQAIPERLGDYLGSLDAAALRRRIVRPQLGNDAGPMGSLCLARAASRCGSGADGHPAHSTSV